MCRRGQAADGPDAACPTVSNGGMVRHGIVQYAHGMDDWRDVIRV